MYPNAISESLVLECMQALMVKVRGTVLDKAAVFECWQDAVAVYRQGTVPVDIVYT